MSSEILTKFFTGFIFRFHGCSEWEEPEVLFLEKVFFKVIVSFREGTMNPFLVSPTSVSGSRRVFVRLSKNFLHVRFPMPRCLELYKRHLLVSDVLHDIPNDANAGRTKPQTPLIALHILCYSGYCLILLFSKENFIWRKIILSTV